VAERPTSRALHPTLPQASAVWPVVVVSGLFAWAASPLAVFLELGVVPVSVGLALLLYWRRPLAAVEFALLLWLVAPGLRRVGDYSTQYHQSSTVLAAAPVVSLLVAGLTVRTRLPIARDAVVVFTTFVLAVGYATAVGLIYSGLVPVGTGALNWLGPAALGLALLWIGAPRTEVLNSVGRVALIGALVLGVYGIVQWAVLPPWDAAWMNNVADELPSIGQAIPRELRVFSLSNSPGPGAAALAGCVLVAAAGRLTLVRVLAVVAGLVTIGLTEVRETWIALALAVLVLALRRQRSSGVLVSCLLVLVIAAPLAPGVSSVVSERFSATTAAGAQDESLNARLDFQRASLPQALSDVFGRGLGSTGAATRVGTSNTTSDFSNTDSGYLEVWRTMGSGVGTVLLLVLFTGVVAVVARRNADATTTALGALLLTLPVQMLLGNSLVGPGAVFVWLAFALFGRASRDRWESGSRAPTIPNTQYRPTRALSTRRSEDDRDIG